MTSFDQSLTAHRESLAEPERRARLRVSRAAPPCNQPEAAHARRYMHLLLLINAFRDEE